VHVIGLDADWQRLADDLTQIVARRGYEEVIDCYQEYVCQTAYRHKHDLNRATCRPANSKDSSNITRLFRLKCMPELFALVISRLHYSLIHPAN